MPPIDTRKREPEAAYLRGQQHHGHAARSASNSAHTALGCFPLHTHRAQREPATPACGRRCRHAAPGPRCLEHELERLAPHWQGVHTRWSRTHVSSSASFAVESFFGSVLSEGSEYLVSFASLPVLAVPPTGLPPTLSPGYDGSLQGQRRRCACVPERPTVASGTAGQPCARACVFGWRRRGCWQAAPAAMLPPALCSLLPPRRDYSRLARLAGSRPTMPCVSACMFTCFTCPGWL